MPLYLYRCSVCGQEVEELRKIGDDGPPEVTCAEGELCDMSKVITNATFKFVGEGWGGWEVQDNGMVQKVTPDKVTTLAPKKKKRDRDKVTGPAPLTTVELPRQGSPAAVEKPKPKADPAV